MNNITDEELNKRLAETLGYKRHKVSTLDAGATDGLPYWQHQTEPTRYGRFSYKDSDIFVECLEWLRKDGYRMASTEAGDVRIYKCPGFCAEDPDLKRCIALARIEADKT